MATITEMLDLSFYMEGDGTLVVRSADRGLTLEVWSYWGDYPDENVIIMNGIEFAWCAHDVEPPQARSLKHYEDPSDLPCPCLMMVAGMLFATIDWEVKPNV